jgi:hypothetical protein
MACVPEIAKNDGISLKFLRLAQRMAGIEKQTAPTVATADIPGYNRDNTINVVWRDRRTTPM